MKFGRRPVAVNIQAAKAMKRDGMSIREIAAALHVGFGTVRRALLKKEEEDA